MNIPYQKGSATSKAAAEAQKPRAPSKIQQIYQFMLERGDHGATDDEIRHGTRMIASTAGARRRDLECLGGCMKTDRRRLTSNGHEAAVYVAVPGVDLSTRKKKGRPRKDNRHTEKITTYLLPEMMKTMNEIADEKGVSASQLMRTAAMEYCRTYRRTTPQDEVLKLEQLSQALTLIQESVESIESGQ